MSGNLDIPMHKISHDDSEIDRQKSFANIRKSHDISRSFVDKDQKISMFAQSLTRD